MRITALAVATLLLAFGAARTSVGQAPATAKILGTVGQSQPLNPTTSVAQRRSETASFAVQQTGGTGDVQQMGGHQPATPYPVFDPSGPHSMGTGTFPYGSSYDRGHPGRPFDGGRYGYFGGAHRTPGYPHHHLHREYVGPQGPPSAQVGYPYYTIRGPRDFLMDNPPSIGR
jgi:hypothetical protein